VPLARRFLRAGAGLLGLALAGTLLVGAATPDAGASPADDHRVTKKSPTAYGWGGAVASVDPEATAAGLRVLRNGGNAVDAAVATAAALGVTEPYSAGIGGGGYFVYYDAATRRVHTIDGRETAPKSMPGTAFTDPVKKEP
jgi:gamma-glutamyltranspeptidase/glutathione hydrolase